MKKLLLLLCLLLLPTLAKGQSSTTTCNAGLTQTTVLSSFADNVPGGITPRNLRDYVCSASTTIVPSIVRPKLLANVTYFVSTTGLDSNNGLTAGTAFKTIQHAINVAEGFDFNNFAITISIGAGTFTEADVVTGLTGGGTLNFSGAGATTIWTASTDSTLTANFSGNTQIGVGNLTIANTDAIANGSLNCIGLSTISINNGLVFGATVGNAAQIYNHDSECTIFADQATYTIAGNAPYHLYTKGGYIFQEASNVTINAGVTVGTFAQAVTGGVIQATSDTYTNNGTVTVKYFVSSGGSINNLGTSSNLGSGINFFPGTFNGNEAVGGVYADNISNEKGIPILAGNSNPVYLSNIAGTTSGAMIYWNGITWQSTLGATQGNVFVAGSGGVPRWGGLTGTTSNLSSNVNMISQFTFFDGPQIAQGTSGTWFVCGTLTLVDPHGAAQFQAKLYDGTTTIADSEQYQAGTNVSTSISLCGIITSPAGNLRMAGWNNSSTSGSILAASVDGGFTPASLIAAFRLQ